MCSFGVERFSDAHSVWTRSFQSFPSREKGEHAGEKTTTSSARGGTAVSGWKRAISVVFWWSPRPQRNALSLVLQSGVDNINIGLPEDKTHTHTHVNHDVIPDAVLPDCLSPTLAA